MVYDLAVQIFMAGSLIFGITMLVFTIGFRSKLRRTERIGRYVLSVLLIFSIFVRFTTQLYGPAPVFVRSVYSLIFDTFYMTICLFYNINLLKRLHWNGKRE